MARLADLMRDDEQQADRSQQNVGAARALLKKGSLAKWQGIVSELDAKRRTTVEAQTAAEALYKVACRNAAMGRTDSAQKQRDALVVLNGAKADAELALGALVAAEAERDAASRADAIVRQADYTDRRAKAYAEAKATARDALNEHQAALRALHESDRVLRSALSAVGEYVVVQPDERHPLHEIDHLFSVLYAATLPVAWAPNVYDLIRKNFTGDPNSMHAPAAAPSWEVNVGRHLQE